MAAVTAAVGGSLAAGYMGKRAAEKGANAQAGAAEYAADLQHQQFQRTRNDLAPWRNTGVQALNSLASLSGLTPESADQALENFQTSPGYQFRLGQGEQAINRAAAARGRLDSGAALQDLAGFNQGIASQEFGQHFNRLAGIAGAGQTAATQTGQFGANAASQQGNALMQAGNARASGYQGEANALSGTIGNLAGIYGMSQANQNPNMQYVNGGWNF